MYHTAKKRLDKICFRECNYENETQSLDACEERVSSMEETYEEITGYSYEQYVAHIRAEIAGE